MSSSVQPTRRSVLKGAAWTAPVIVVATATPALAATGAANLSVAVQSATSAGNPRVLTVQSLITNTGSLASTALTVRLTVALNNANQALVPTASAQGYTPALVTGVGTPTVSPTSYTFDFTATDQIAANSTKPFSATVNLNATANTSGTVTVRATPGGSGTAGQGSLAIS